MEDYLIEKKNEIFKLLEKYNASKEDLNNYLSRIIRVEEAERLWGVRIRDKYMGLPNNWDKKLSEIVSIFRQLERKGILFKDFKEFINK